ncbi:MAG: hypothetical protein NTU98_09765 [Bacteroidetes bacterium]|nr:hypothetical protein [Bacteroidota bacterium]
MNRILTVLIVVLIASVGTSYAGTHPNQKKLIGTWKAVKVERYNMPSMPAQASSTASPASKAKATPGDTVSAANQAKKMEEQLARIIQVEERSTLTINADKTAVKEVPGKTIHAKWKLKNKGTKLIVDLQETGKKMNIDILRINDTSIVVVTNLPVGGLKVTYKKQKTVAPKETPTEAPKKK